MGRGPARHLLLAGGIGITPVLAMARQLDPLALVSETGTAAWARIVDASAGTICDADVGVTNSGAVVELDNLSLVEGGYCTITSFVLTER